MRVDSKQEEGQPQSVHGGDSKEPEVLASPNQRRERAVSKAEVLERAKSYIKSLEDEHERLVAERDELLRVWEASRMKCEVLVLETGAIKTITKEKEKFETS